MILKFKDPNNNATVIIDNIEKVEIDTENYSVKYNTDASIKWYLRLPELIDERTQKVYYGVNLQYLDHDSRSLQETAELHLSYNRHDDVSKCRVITYHVKNSKAHNEIALHIYKNVYILSDDGKLIDKLWNFY